MGLSKIQLLNGSQLILACDEQGRLAWTPSLETLSSEISKLNLPADHPIRTTLRDMETEQTWNLILPYKDVFDRLEVVGA